MTNRDIVEYSPTACGCRPGRGERIMNNQATSRISGVSLDLVCSGQVMVTHDQLLQQKKAPLTLGGEPIPQATIKHADDQTIIALLALQRAITSKSLTGFENWGVLAAPRFIGRAGMAEAWQRFQTEGAWGISPHLIPHRSLHSVSGTISLVLKSRGPNFGVGGGAGAIAECLLAAAGMMRESKVPGTWIVCTSMDPELPPLENGHLLPEARWLGLALALVPQAQSSSSRSLRIFSETPRIHLRAFNEWEESVRSCFDLQDLLVLLEELEGRNVPDKPIQASLGGGLRIEFVPSRAANLRRAA